MFEIHRRNITYFHLTRKIRYNKELFQVSGCFCSACNVVSACAFSVNSWKLFWACAWEVILCHF